jgi:hypothetical protein
MTTHEFTRLLSELVEARLEHSDWCEEYEQDDSCPGREAAWARVEALQARVDEVLKAEVEAGAAR